MSFADLLGELGAAARWQIANGRFSERSLAGKVGCSQSLVHNVLTGARRLTPATADKLLVALGLTIEDLIAGRGRAWPCN